LISGLMAGPAVSLYGSPTVSPDTIVPTSTPPRARMPARGYCSRESGS
jgi:hypothetical protein